MTRTEQKQVVRTAIDEYKSAKRSHDPEKISHAISMLENTFIMVSPFAVEGTAELVSIIRKEKYQHLCAEQGEKL